MLELNTAEAQFLHKLLQERNLREYFDAQVRGIDEDTFSEEATKLVWQFVKDYITRYNRFPDIRTVQEQIPTFTPGITPDHLDFYRDKLLKQTQTFKLSVFVRDLALKIQSQEPDTLEFIGRTYSDLIKGTRISDFGRFRDMMDRINQYERKLTAGENPMGIPTGIQELDDHFLGFRPGDYGVITGRPGEGKTTVALFFAFSAFMANYKVSYITLEMPREQLFEKLDALATGIVINKIRRLRLNNAELELYKRKAEQIHSHESDINIHDRTGSCTPVTIEAIINQDEPDIIFVDPIYLMKYPKGQNGWEGIKQNSNDIKQLAMKYRKPIIILSQLNREGGKAIKMGEDPKLEDMAYADALGQDADHAFALVESAKLKALHAKRLISTKLRGAEQVDLAIKWDPTTNNIGFLDYYDKVRGADANVAQVIQLQQAYAANQQQGGPLDVNTTSTQPA